MRLCAPTAACGGSLFDPWGSLSLPRSALLNANTINNPLPASTHACPPRPRPKTAQIHHTALVERAAALGALQERAAALQARLDSYHNLPASELGAKVMLQQARERLAAAQQQLESGLADL